MDTAVDPRTLRWINRPALYTVDEDSVLLETTPHTGFHSLTFNEICANGLVLEPMTGFSFSARMRYHFEGPENECGIFLQENAGHWMKGGIQDRRENLKLSCMVYDNGYGDEALREIGSAVKEMSLRVLYWNGNVRFQYSFGGEQYSDMRWMHFADSSVTVTPGIFACSPGSDVFDCRFTDLCLQKI